MLHCVFQCVAVCCSVLQCVAVCCSVLRLVASCKVVIRDDLFSESFICDFECSHGMLRIHMGR